MKNLKLRKIGLSLLLLLTLVSLSACGKKEEEVTAEKEKEAIEVHAQKVSDSRTLIENLEFPGLISSEQEARIVAKVGGTVKGFSAAAGAEVKIGDLLATIDDAKGGLYSGADTSQIRQAQIGVSQAASALDLAESSYRSVLAQTEKDLEQARIARDQAASGKSNVAKQSQESIKSAEIALEQARLAVSVAQNNLDKQKNIIAENETNNQTNARLAIDSVIDQGHLIIDGANNLAAFDDSDGTRISYEDGLGKLDLNTFDSAKIAYYNAEKEYKAVLALGSASDLPRAEAGIKLAESIKRLADALKKLVDNSISTPSLPENSAAGVSLNSLKAQTNAYQSQAIALINQANSAKQILIGSGLSSDFSLSSLEKALELAKKQEDGAQQALRSLETGTKSQGDAAGYGAESAQAAYNSALERINLQKKSAESQVNVARLSYQNALTALEGLYDIHEAISPIDGIIVSKLVSDGQTVSAGQELAIISQPGRIKLSFFVDGENVSYLGLGAKAAIKTTDGQEIPALISALTPLADSQSKRFKVELSPEKADGDVPALGSVASALVSIKKSTIEKDNIILALSAIEVSQNDSSIYLVSEDKAKKEKVEITRVIGEAAEIRTSLGSDVYIIVDGTKNIHEGDPIKIISK